MKKVIFLANASAQAETLLQRLERAAAGIGHYVHAHKTEYMCFNQTGDSSTLNGSSLKLVNKFTNSGSSVSSAKTDIDIRPVKAWTVINRRSVIWNSDLTDKKKRTFFQTAVLSILLYGCTIWTLTERKRPALFKSGQWHFHQDNATVHNSILVIDYLTKMGIKTVP